MNKLSRVIALDIFSSNTSSRSVAFVCVILKFYKSSYKINVLDCVLRIVTLWVKFCARMWIPFKKISNKTIEHDLQRTQFEKNRILKKVRMWIKEIRSWSELSRTASSGVFLKLLQLLKFLPSASGARQYISNEPNVFGESVVRLRSEVWYSSMNTLFCDSFSYTKVCVVIFSFTWYQSMCVVVLSLHTL